MFVGYFNLEVEVRHLLFFSVAYASDTDDSQPNFHSLPLVCYANVSATELFCFGEVKDSDRVAGEPFTGIFKVETGLWAMGGKSYDGSIIRPILENPSDYVASREVYSVNANLPEGFDIILKRV
eukprot:scaffold1593_cov193-Alexandrium_tamarense.AAC.58